MFTGQFGCYWFGFGFGTVLIACQWFPAWYSTTSPWDLLEMCIDIFGWLKVETSICKIGKGTRMLYVLYAGWFYIRKDYATQNAVSDPMKIYWDISLPTTSPPFKMHSGVSKAIPRLGNLAKRPQNWMHSFQGAVPKWLAANQTRWQSREGQAYFDV